MAIPKTSLTFGVENNKKEEMIGTIDNILSDEDQKEGIIYKLNQITVTEAKTLYNLVKNDYMDN